MAFPQTGTGGGAVAEAGRWGPQPFHRFRSSRVWRETARRSRSRRRGNTGTMCSECWPSPPRWPSRSWGCTSGLAGESPRTQARRARSDAAVRRRRAGTAPRGAGPRRAVRAGDRGPRRRGPDPRRAKSAARPRADVNRGGLIPMPVRDPCRRRSARGWGRSTSCVGIQAPLFPEPGPSILPTVTAQAASSSSRPTTRMAVPWRSSLPSGPARRRGCPRCRTPARDGDLPARHRPWH
jgi:hypothetical protein